MLEQYQSLRSIILIKQANHAGVFNNPPVLLPNGCFIWNINIMILSSSFTATNTSFSQEMSHTKWLSKHDLCETISQILTTQHSFQDQYMTKAKTLTRNRNTQGGKQLEAVSLERDKIHRTSVLKAWQSSHSSAGMERVWTVSCEWWMGFLVEVVGGRLFPQDSGVSGWRVGIFLYAVVCFWWRQRLCSRSWYHFW